MAFLIPAGLFIIGLLCCIGITFLVVQARADERKAVAQKVLVMTQKTSTRSATPTTTVIPATPVPSPSSSTSSETLTSPTSSTSSTSSTTSTDESVDDDATVRKPYNKEVSAQMGEETTNLPTTEPIGDQQERQERQEAQNGNGKSHGNGHNGHGELQNLQLYTEMEQLVELFQDGKLSPEWMHEQIQELSVKVHDLHQQSSLVERHIALLNQIAVYMNELEQVRHEYKVLREKRGAVLRIPTRLHGEDADGDTYIQTDKRPAMRKYTLKTM